MQRIVTPFEIHAPCCCHARTLPATRSAPPRSAAMHACARLWTRDSPKGCSPLGHYPEHGKLMKDFRERGEGQREARSALALE